MGYRTLYDSHEALDGHITDATALPAPPSAGATIIRDAHQYAQLDVGLKLVDGVVADAVVQLHWKGHQGPDVDPMRWATDESTERGMKITVDLSSSDYASVSFPDPPGRDCVVSVTPGAGGGSLYAQIGGRLR